MFYVFIISPVSGLIASFIASTKQRNALAWFAIGALLPVIGVVAAFVVAPRARQTDEPPDAPVPILPTQWVPTFVGDPDVVTCAFCRQSVSRARCIGTADGVLCNRCEESRR